MTLPNNFIRGEIYHVDLNPTKGAEINKIRSCVIVGATPINQARSTVVVIPLSSSAKARLPLVVPIKTMGAHAVAVCDQIRAIDKSRIKNKIGQLSSQEMDLLADNLRITLGL